MRSIKASTARIYRSWLRYRTCAVVDTPLQLIMPTLSTLLHSVTLAALMTHEIDAGLRHEWRVLPLTSFLPENTGRRAFVWLHLPIYAAAIAWDANVRRNNVDSHGDTHCAQATYRRCLALFSLIHVALHVAFRHHPSYEFNDMEAWAPILISAASGALYLAIVP